MDFIEKEKKESLFYRSAISSYSFLVASTIFIFIAFLLLVSAFMFALGSNLSQFPIIMSMCCTPIFLYLAISSHFHENKLKTFLELFSFLIILFLFCMYIAGIFYDLSWDGQAYHQAGIIHLGNGWNPFYKTSLPESRYCIPRSDVLCISYSKGPEICAATLYKLTGHIEQGKLFNLLLMFGSFFVSLSSLLYFKKLKTSIAFLLSFIIINPVSICQCFTFYADGQLASLLTSLIAVFAILFFRNDTLTLLTLGAIIIITSNVKFTGVVYAAVLIIGFCFVLYLFRKRDTMKKLILTSLIGFVIAIFFVGYNPYITNTLTHGHPFYPICGKNKIDVMRYQMSKNFLNKDRFTKIFVSTFSESSDSLDDDPKFKYPFVSVTQG